MIEKDGLTMEELIELNEFFHNEAPINPELFLQKDINIKNIIFLSFVEDEETDEYLGYFYHRENQKFYRYIFNTLDNALEIHKTIKPNINECRTVSILDNYLIL